MNDSLVYLPQSGDWVCASCDGPLSPTDTAVTYLEGGFTITVLACPKCGLSLLPESVAVGKMLEVEQLLEDK
ncbi:DVU_1557 family redox protein [Solidesulfovibrio sp.]|uniref:DVU_1557 family redox protein n=1 Tax=Solidesulfovibrio sp. TaxID=2910990 RepID=UPI002B1F980D|nr:CLJU_RS11820 family redox protein [Solidesulfovibrio sp.]MEA4855993.1 DNA-binding protein [Solidesulfovibrio sp.]